MFDETPRAAAPRTIEEPDVYEINAFDVDAFVAAVAESSSTRPAVERPSREPQASVAATVVMPARRHAAADRRIAATRTKPAQDEWGFFDPDQAGFAALLAKLEEMVDDEPPTRRRGA
jgi:hypothetical protein